MADTKHTRTVNPHATAENIVNEVEYFDRLKRAGVPEHLQEGLVRYLVYRIAPGSFLLAVLENDLAGAINRGDEASVAGLQALVRFLYHHAPAVAYGGPQIVRTWLTREESVVFGGGI